MPGFGGDGERASQHSTALSLHLHQLRAEFRDLGLDAPESRRWMRLGDLSGAGGEEPQPRR